MRAARPASASVSPVKNKIAAKQKASSPVKPSNMVSVVSQSALKEEPRLDGPSPYIAPEANIEGRSQIQVPPVSSTTAPAANAKPPTPAERLFRADTASKRGKMVNGSRGGSPLPHPNELPLTHQ